MKVHFSLLLLFLLAACSQENGGETTENSLTEFEGFSFFGDTLDTNEPKSIDVFISEVNQSGVGMGQLEGDILECCQKKGCWMKVQVPGYEEPIRVTFKDYGFFVPKDAGGRKVVLEGKAYFDTVSVDVLKHYAEDSGKPQEEIDAIMEPQIALAFEATGVAIQDPRNEE